MPLLWPSCCLPPLPQCCLVKLMEVEGNLSFFSSALVCFSLSAPLQFTKCTLHTLWWSFQSAHSFSLLALLLTAAACWTGAGSITQPTCSPRSPAFFSVSFCSCFWEGPSSGVFLFFHFSRDSSCASSVTSPSLFFPSFVLFLFLFSFVSFFFSPLHYLVCCCCFCFLPLLARGLSLAQQLVQLQLLVLLVQPSAAAEACAAWAAAASASLLRAFSLILFVISS